jgi:hypothetical protein
MPPARAGPAFLEVIAAKTPMTLAATMTIAIVGDQGWLIGTAAATNKVECNITYSYNLKNSVQAERSDRNQMIFVAVRNN